MRPRRGTVALARSMLILPRMKPVLFIILLALGPVLAEHTSVPGPAMAFASAADTGSGPISGATTPETERWAWLRRART